MQIKNDKNKDRCNVDVINNMYDKYVIKLTEPFTQRITKEKIFNKTNICIENPRLYEIQTMREKLKIIDTFYRHRKSNSCVNDKMHPVEDVKNNNLVENNFK